MDLRRYEGKLLRISFHRECAPGQLGDLKALYYNRLEQLPRHYLIQHKMVRGDQFCTLECSGLLLYKYSWLYLI